MKVLVLGGAGYLGSHVADALTECGHDVAVFDLRKSPYLRPKQTMIVADVLDEKALDAAVRGRAAVYNFAGYADIESAQDKPIETIKLNVLANGMALEACRRHKVRRYVFASTVYVYSETGSFYRASKQACEAYIEEYQRRYGLPYTIARFGSLYGPRADHRNGIYRLIEQAVKTKKIVYHGTGDEIREFIHVRDAAASCADLLGKEHENERIVLTGAQTVKTKDLLNMLKEILNNRIRIEFKPLKSGRSASVHYAITPYSFTPKVGRKMIRTRFVDLGQGLLECIGDFHRIA